MKLGDLLNRLAISSGTAVDDAKLKIILSSTAISDQDVDDVIANSMLNNLLTEASAIAHPKIKAQIMAAALNPLDSKIDALAEEHGLTDKWIAFRDANVKKNGDGKINTYDAFEKFNKFVASETKASLTGTMTTDKAKLVKDIEVLNATALTVKTDYERKLSEVNSARSADRINWTLDSMYAGYNYAMEESNKMPKNACVIAAKAFVNNKLQEDGVKIVQDDQGNIELRTKEDSPFFIQNQKVGVSDYFSKVLTDNNFLKISAKSDNSGGAGNGKLPVIDTSKLTSGQRSAVSTLDAMLAQESE